MSFEHESEAMLEEKLIKHLELLGYTRINLKNLNDVKENFRKQINKHNIDELKGIDNINIHHNAKIAS